MYCIGLTGGIACGKSTVSKRLRIIGAYVIDADQVTAKLMEPGGAIFDAYREHFGDEVILPDWTLDRKALGARIFGHPQELRWVNDTTHPLIRAQIRREIDMAEARGRNVVVLDIPLLLESGWQAFVDEVWVVYITPEEQLRRLMARNGFTREEALERIQAQMPLKEKMRYADVLINNGGTRDELYHQIKHFWKMSGRRLFSMAEQAYLEHAAVTVRDLDWSIAFFRDVFGMEITRRKEVDGVVRQVWLRGGLQLVAAPENWESGQAHHLGLVVKDFDSVRTKALTYEGVTPIEGKPKKWLHLPDGLVLELFQEQAGAIDQILSITVK